MFNQSKLLMRPSYTTNDNRQKSYNAEGVMKKREGKMKYSNNTIYRYSRYKYTNSTYCYSISIRT